MTKEEAEKIFKEAIIRSYKSVYRKAVRQERENRPRISTTYKPVSIRKYIEGFLNHPILGDTAAEMLAVYKK